MQLIHQPTGIVVKCQETRSRSQNRKIARRLLAEKVDRLEKGDESRSAWKEHREKKKRASKVKKSRRKYRALKDMKEGNAEGLRQINNAELEVTANYEKLVE